MPAQASGIIIIIACGREQPPMTSSSSALSKQAESVWSSPMIGKSFSRSSPNSSEERRPSRARIQLTLPRRVLISPLWPT
ncbi:MAG: hypothetical protein MPW14_23785 [Candidatus Manganitrophus sp.]|nr:MAG: hypothetical protein MPW14_23785 [Candidatus Manganitrophus sp.]